MGREMEEQEKKGPATKPYSQTCDKRKRKKYTEIEKSKNQEAKGRKGNFRKSWQETWQIKVRHSLERISLCVFHLVVGWAPKEKE